MRRLVVLRPEPGASVTVERAAAMGLDAVAMPLFRVEPLEWEVPHTREIDALLLTSANAVRHGGAGLQRLSGLPVYAVGEGTASAARRAGFNVVRAGDGGVERLLEGIPADSRLLHLCGEHRTQIHSRQTITAVPAYRSIELPAPSGLRQVDGQAIAVHSPRAGRRLAELVDQAAVNRSTIRVAAISEAAAEAAGPGWERCEAAASPDETALLALAARLCDNRLAR